MKLRPLTIAAALALTCAMPAYACNEHHQPAAHHMDMTPKVSKKLRNDPAVKSYVKANKVMHKGMDIPYSGDADVDFVAGMIPHHQGAVDMALVELKYGKDEEMKALARRIITWQESEIGNMKSWLKGRTSEWQAPNAYEMESVKAYQDAMHTMHMDMNIRYSGNVDVDFARGMIPHHQGAIDMAWVLKDHGRDFGLRRFADEIIRSQGQEIRLMEEWLARQGK